MGEDDRSAVPAPHRGRHRRPGRRSLPLALVMGLLVLPFAALEASAADPAPVRPQRPALHVRLTPTGFEPASIDLLTGQQVVFENATAVDQTVAGAAGTLVDSGTIPPGGGYVTSFAAPGSFPVQSAGTPAAAATVRVGLGALVGDPGAPAAPRLPDLAPPVNVEADMAEHPDLGRRVSRHQLVVTLAPGATVAQVDAAVAAADAGIVSGWPEMGMAVVQVVDDGTLAPLDAAFDALNAAEGIAGVAYDAETTTGSVPRDPEEPLRSQVNWWWETSGSPGALGTGGNYGLEDARFPEAWNLLDHLRRTPSSVRQVVIDGGFASHPDLAVAVVPVCRRAFLVTETCTTDGGTPSRIDHGTLVSGVIGATYNNQAPSGPEHSIGVSGANPMAELVGVGAWTDFSIGVAIGPSVSTLSATVHAFDGVFDGMATGGPFAGTRVINYSMGFPLDGNRWRSRYPTPTCGPGADDDGDRGSTSWCTPMNADASIETSAGNAVVATTLAWRAQAANVLIVQAAGNESHLLCAAGGAVPGCPKVVIDSGTSSMFAGAAYRWPGGAAASPILVAEAMDRFRNRSPYSNTVSVAGVGVAAAGGSTSGATSCGATPWSDSQVVGPVSAGCYAGNEGTSFAAPHVSRAGRVARRGPTDRGHGTDQAADPGLRQPRHHRHQPPHRRLRLRGGRRTAAAGRPGRRGR